MYDFVFEQHPGLLIELTLSTGRKVRGYPSQALMRNGNEVVLVTRWRRAAIRFNVRHIVSARVIN